MNLFQVTKKQPSSGLELKTFTGNPVTFTPTYSEALPAPFNGTNLKVAIVASGGNGTPSTPIPIVGHSELNLVRSGKNLLDYKNADHIGTGATYSGGVYTYPQQYAVVEWNIPIGAGNYVASINIDEINGSIICLEISNNDGTPFDVRSYITVTGVSSKTFTITDQTSIKVSAWCSVYSGTAKVSSCQLELGSTATAYAPYNGDTFTVSFGQTVYGGVYDANRGNVRLNMSNLIDMLNDVEWYLADADNHIFRTEDLPIKVPETYADRKIGFMCNIYKPSENISIGVPMDNLGMLRYSTQILIRNNDCSNVNEFKATLTGGKMVYELATPIEIDVSELAVDTIVGTNNITSDCGGDVEVTCLI